MRLALASCQKTPRRRAGGRRHKHKKGEFVDLLSEMNLLETSRSFLHAVRPIGACAGCDAIVLLRGDTGSGRAVAPRPIHRLGAGGCGPLVPVHYVAFPDPAMRIELFGHARSPNPITRKPRQGFVASAEGSALFQAEAGVISRKGS